MVPNDHVLRKIRSVADEALAPMLRAYESSYASGGRVGVPPKVIILAKLLQALFSIRSERALCEQIKWNAAYRWFVGLDWDDEVFDHSTISANRERLFGDGAAEALLGETVRVAEEKGLLSSDRLVVDGTLIKAWASMKSFKAKDGSEDDKPNFKGTKRSNQTHSSRTDEDARIFRKGRGQESMLAYMGHVAVDARSMIVRACTTTLATGNRKSRIDERTTQKEGYEISQRKRKRIEEIFGWQKTVGGLHRLKRRGLHRVEEFFVFCGAAYNLLRMANIAKLQAKAA
jgi:transposase